MSMLDRAYHASLDISAHLPAIVKKVLVDILNQFTKKKTSTVLDITVAT